MLRIISARHLGFRLRPRRRLGIRPKQADQPMRLVLRPQLCELPLIRADPAIAAR